MLSFSLLSMLACHEMDTIFRGVADLNITSDSSRVESHHLTTSVEEEDFILKDLLELPIEICERRPTCLRCCRPEKVCLCPFLPGCPLDVSTCLYIVQHPAEESRVLRTVPLLAACLPPGKCKVFVGRRFSEERNPELAAVCQHSKTLLLYPGAEAQNLQDMNEIVTGDVQNVIIIDGTWSQAKDMFFKNSLFHLPKQVLLKPLRALCSFQLQHGAQVHHSKEHLLKCGLYDKPLPKNKRKMKRIQKLITNQKI
ncbi:tRNA-uridine aminocarboxypropyltransferase 2 isoform X2 [Alosa sapidissima]|uniref:tRNA-uridine aminocarboxypropyltransferase 2 isoform X2 n=1 Tax=Alosa sapidissima TaxID=34773 RepID=UPI001C099C1D|nr:tRNA-uridine aminocarboxypropyltransferase 2 isoform X2 [Alosa sapidissima]